MRPWPVHHAGNASLPPLVHEGLVLLDEVGCRYLCGFLIGRTERAFNEFLAGRL